VLFVLSAAGCLVVTNIVQQVHEPAEQPVVTVWREMRSMRTFNPMLSVLAVGELLLTPRGLVALGKRWLRTVRRQVKVLEEVGEELVIGGREALELEGRKPKSQNPGKPEGGRTRPG
jgi:hypothetical protein